MKRTHTCGELRSGDVDSEVVLAGWVDRVRDLGGLTFIDLRDRAGITQVLIRPEAGPSVVEAAKDVGSEWVLAVRGKVLKRSNDTINSNIDTGAVEVGADEIEILSRAKTPPFSLDDKTKANEDLRLRYRYLDLRRPTLHNNLKTRSKLAYAARSYLADEAFYEIETPFLTKSTPEGARDYLVPSRVHHGSFYALPQSPQIFKQLLMISGMERYFQIVRCFRDEDLRADRQPEFTQIDIEMSFVDQEDVLALTEGLFARMLSAVDIPVTPPFPRLTYQEAMDRYGSDKPDTRFGCEIVDLSDLVAGSSYGIFEKVLSEGGCVRAIGGKNLAGYSRKDIERVEEIAKAQGAGGLGWARWTDDQLKSPLAKHLGDERLKRAFELCGAGAGDLLLIVAGDAAMVSAVLGFLRLELAKREGWIPGDAPWSFLWVTDFPLFEYSECDGRYYSMHHPFTSPHPEDLDLLETDPARVRSQGYDLVANGNELGGGSIRIHDAEVQARVFKALSLSDEQAREKFGFFLEALQYGTPPHGGIACGFDRIAMLASGGSSLRDVIAFPKTTSAFDLMTGSPAGVTAEQLQDLAIELSSDESDP